MILIRPVHLIDGLKDRIGLVLGLLFLGLRFLSSLFLSPLLILVFLELIALIQVILRVETGVIWVLLIVSHKSNGSIGFAPNLILDVVLLALNHPQFLLFICLLLVHIEVSSIVHIILELLVQLLILVLIPLLLNVVSELL